MVYRATERSGVAARCERRSCKRNASRKNRRLGCASRSINATDGFTWLRAFMK